VIRAALGRWCLAVVGVADHAGDHAVETGQVAGLRCVVALAAGEPVVEASDEIARAGNGVGVRKRPISVL
jgi:hypothetical protein